MKKRIMSILLTAALVLSCAPLMSLTASAVSIDQLVFTLNEEGTEYMLSGYTELCSGELVIPSTYNGLPVTSIRRDSFRNCTDITSVTIPGSIEVISDGAFELCSGIVSITFEQGVKEIGGSSFLLCSGLTFLSMPESLESIGTSVFKMCTSLTSVSIPGSVTSIGGEAFYDCTLLKDVTINNEDCLIGNNAFSGTAWYNAQPDGLIYLSGNVIAYKGTMPSNTTLTIGDGTHNISDVAFRGREELASVSLPSSLRSIGYGAFEACINLTSVYIPEGLTQINNNAFYGCSGLSSIVLPKSVTGLGSSVFYGCNSMKEATLLCSVTEIPQYFFAGCSSLTSITIPDGVTTIERQAFGSCSALATIAMPDSVVAVGEKAFINTAWYNSQPDGLVVAGKIAYCYKGAMPSGTVVTIPDGVIGIATNAFKYCENLNEVHIPQGVKHIGAGAFYRCMSLTDIVLPDSVEVLESSAFSSCSSLKSVKLGSSLRQLGEYAFGFCSLITEIELPASLSDMSFNSFQGCISLESINIAKENSVYSSIDGVWFDKSGSVLISCPMGKSGDYVVPDGVTTIPSYAFDSNQKLTSVTLPVGVTKIEKTAFIGCASLVTVIIREGITEIKEFTFGDCPELSLVMIPNSVVKMEADVFFNCPNVSIYGYIGSCAESYAAQNDILFVPYTNVFSDTLGVSGYGVIFWLKSGDTLGDMLPQLVSDYALKVYDLWDNEVTDASTPLTTGMVLCAVDGEGEVIEAFELSVLGDTDGDGKVTTTDARMTLRVAAQLDSFTLGQYMAAEVDGDYNNITTTDARILLRVAAELESLWA